MIFERVAIVAGMLFVHILNGSSLFDISPDVKPDFMIIFVIFFALRKGEMSGLWIGFFGGLLSDAGLGGEEGKNGEIYYKVGIHSLSFSLVGYLLGKFGRGFYNENYITISIYAFVLTLIMRSIVYLVFSTFFYSNQNYSFLFSSVYNAILAPVTFFIMSWVYRLDASEAVR